MSIASRIEQIEQHISDDYSILTLGGADLTNVDKNIQNLKTQWKSRLEYYLANGLDVVWNNWNKITGSGTEISLNNTIQAPMKIVYGGNTYQESTTGKNLFPIPINSETTVNDVKFTPNEDGSITVKGTSTANYTSVSLGTHYPLSAGTYILSCINDSNDIYAQFYDGTNYRTSRQSSFTLSNNVEGYRWAITIPTSGTVVDTTLYPQLEKNSQATSFEKFTGGSPAPNPSYPQNVQVVSGNNNITISNSDNTQSQTYPINLGNIELCKIGTYQDKIAKSSGKNLLDLKDGTYTIASEITANVNNGEITLNGTATANRFLTIDLSSNLNLTYGEQYTISTNNSVANSNVRFRIDDDGSYDTILNTTNATKTITYSSDSNLYSNQIKIRIASGTTLTNYKIIPQIEKGSSATSYEPYGKVWYLNKQIGKYVFTGSENWNVQATDTNFSTFQRADILIDEAKANNFQQGQCLSNFFKTAISWNIWLNTDVGIDAYVKRVILTTPSSIATTKATLNQWLSSNNVLLYYVLATPTYTKITDQTLIYQLEQIKYSYSSQTNISQTNNDMPFELDVNALESM